MKENLFRKEVIESKKNLNYGTVSINTPAHYLFVTVGFSLLVTLIILFLIFGEYSEKFIVTGFLNSSKGIVRVYANKSGVITRSHVNQGAHVKKGEPLFLIDTSYDGLKENNAHEVLAQLQKRMKIIEKEILYKTAELHALKPLLQKKFIPLTAYHEKHEEIVALENNKNLIDMDIIKYKQESAYLIRSPVNGIVSSVSYKEGQYTNLSKPLIKILPDNANLIAELFVPVNHSGFLNKDNKIIIRYDAYPYERFGTYKAAIKTISESILTDEEEEKPVTIGQPYYKVTAQLDSQFVTLYGAPKKVQHGMTITAVIVGSRRKIWQWILDPLYSFYGGLVV
ncbi:MAG: HlyD family efflux transporter periplasmic adaptor subunit [Legionella sp.]|nr:HlyD family efflux transporter periplasmic adaptor subunit [Legionella sp.]